MGGNGCTFAYNTAAYTPPSGSFFGAFVAGPAGATISAYAGGITNIAQIYTVALPPGYIILDPHITSVTLSAGSAFLYIA